MHPTDQLLPKPPLYFARTPVPSGRAALCWILTVLIGIRPASEIFWQHEFLGANLQSHVAFIAFAISSLLLLTTRRLPKHMAHLVLAIVVYSTYIAFFALIDKNSLFIQETSKTFTSLITAASVMVTFQRKHIKLLLPLFCFSILALTFLSYMQLFGLYELHYFSGSVIEGQLVGRVSGGLSHPNDLNRTLIFFVLIILFLVPQHRDITKFALLVPVLFVIAYTFHRTTYLSATATIFLYLVSRRRYAIISGCIASASAIVAYYFEWFWYFIVVQRLSVDLGLSESRFRSSYASIVMFLDAPLYRKLYGSGIFPDQRVFGDGDIARILYAYGIVGFVCYCWFFISTVYVATGKHGRETRYALISLFFVWIIYSIFVDTTRYPAFVVMYFVCLKWILLRDDKAA